MIRLRFVVLAILTAGIFAGCLTYFVMPLAQLDTDHRLQASVPTFIARTEPVGKNTDRHLAAEQQAADALAYAGADEPAITGHIPLPKRRPIPR
jgi:hypothetical protein